MGSLTFLLTFCNFLLKDTSIGFMAAKAVKTEQGEEFKQVKTEELDAEDDPFA